MYFVHPPGTIMVSVFEISQTYMHTYINPGRKTDRQTGRQADRQTDR